MLLTCAKRIIIFRRCGLCMLFHVFFLCTYLLAMFFLIFLPCYIRWIKITTNANKLLIVILETAKTDPSRPRPQNSGLDRAVSRPRPRSRGLSSLPWANPYSTLCWRVWLCVFVYVRSELSLARFRRGRRRRAAGRLLQVDRVVDAWRKRRRRMLCFSVVRILSAAGPAAPARLRHSVGSGRRPRVNAAVVRLHSGTGASLSVNQSGRRCSHARKQTSGKFGRVITTGTTPPIPVSPHHSVFTDRGCDHSPIIHPSITAPDVEQLR